MRCDFRLNISGSTWTLVDVEVAWTKLKNTRSVILPVIGDLPSATLDPLQSFRCSRPLTFSSDNATLIMQSYQVNISQS